MKNANRLITEDDRRLTRPGNLTVGQLIERLQELPEDATVLFVCDYGDHHHTAQVLPVADAIEMGDEEYLTESAYSRSGMALESTEDGSAEDGDFCGDLYEASKTARPQVVILR